MPRARRAAPRRPRWRRRPEDRPEEILRAALRVFAERGFAQARLEEVARKAGVSKGTLYLYFDSKDALFREVVRATKGPILAESEAWLDAFDGSARDALAHFIRGMWRRMADPDQAAISRLVHCEIKHFPELARFYFEEVIVRGRRLIQSVLDRGIARGEFRTDLHGFAARGLPHLMVFSAQTQCFFAAMDPERLRDEQVLDGILDLYLHGVEARPPAGPAA